MSEHDKLRAAVDVMDRSAARTKPNAQTEAWSTIRAHIEAQAAEIGECFRLAGGDTDGNPGPHHAHRAVEVVRDLRECYEERGGDLEKAEAEIAQLREYVGELNVLLDAAKHERDAAEAEADAMRGGAE